nr:metallophosphoesterase [Metabacillus mangrovi]
MTVKVDTQGKTADNWSVKLTPTNHSPLSSEYELPVKNTAPGSSHWKKSVSIQDVTVEIPAEVPEQLYDLEVSYTADGKQITDRQPHSVKAVDEFKKDFTFFHVTDTHVGSPRNLADGISSVSIARSKETGMWHPDKDKRWLYLQKTISEVNLAKPDFVVITGDLMFGQLNPLEYVYEYKETYEVLQKLNVPVFLVPGNHDYYAQDATLTDGAKYWENYFGPQYFSFDYGPYAHFIGYNSFDWNKINRSGSGTVLVPTWGGQIRNEQLDWIKNDLAQNAEKSDDSQIRGLFSHHNPLWRDRDLWPQTDHDVQRYWEQYDEQHDPQKLTTLALGMKLGIKYDQQWHGEGAQELVDVMEQYEVDTSLHGHTHEDNITEQNGILYATTTAIELSGKPYAGFRNFTVQDGLLKDYIYEGEHSSIPIYENGDITTRTMSYEASYEEANDGQAESQQVTLTNRLKKPMTVSVPVYMKEGTYQVSAGKTVQNYSADGKQYLEVKRTIPAGTTETITIQK